MKRVLYCVLLGAAIFAIAPFAWSETASPTDMQQVAANWLTQITYERGNWAVSPNPIITGYHDIVSGDTVPARWFDISPRGYVLVSALKEMTPVKAYSDVSNLTDLQEGGFISMVRESSSKLFGTYVQEFGSLDASQPSTGETVFGRGRRVLGFSPFWPCLTGNIFPYGENEFHTFELDETAHGMTFDPDRFEHALREVDLFYFNTPHNPTGKVFSYNETKLIDELCRKHGVVIISDEPYDQILYDGVKHTSMLEFDNERTIVVFTMSKSFAATGLRVGYVVCRDPRVCDLYSRADYSQTAGVATPLQDAYAVALTDKPNRDAWLSGLRTELQQRRDTLYDELAGAFPSLTKPQGAFYFFPNVSHLVPSGVKNSDDYLLKLFMDNDVAVIPGGTFGREGHVRISFSATPVEQSRIGARKFAGVVKQLVG